ncbi:MAG: type II secretion system protein GspE [Planctomycetota bacterium]|nr:MAG: type II secretion system protein GspE [Planctomycetota bacterium]
MTKFDKRLKKIMEKRGLLDKETAGKLLERCAEDNKPLCEIAIEDNLVDERTLVNAIALETNLAPIDLENYSPDEDVLSAFPQEMARANDVLPVSKLDNTLTLAVANPFDVLKLDDLRIMTGCDLQLVASTTYRIRRAIPAAYNPNEQAMEEIFEGMAKPEVELTSADEEEEEINLAELSDDDEESPVIKIVNLIIAQAIHDKVSDIHIEPMEKKLRVRYRQDGLLREAISPPRQMAGAITSRLKVMAGLDIAERRKPQDGKFRLKVEGRAVDFRVSVLPTIHGEKVVLRVLDTSNLALSLDGLGFEEKALTDLRNALAAPFGMILVTGPTGSGKSTTLYSSLKEVMSIQDNIVTVEDPVEYELPGIIQVPVSVKRGLTFAAALRSILRQDPDKVMVGEIRDTETVDIAVKAALTGHLVLSTLHTNDAASAITRMVDMGVDPFLVASSVLLVSAQRLARKLCPLCREEVKVPKERLLSIGVKPEEIKDAKFYRARGCNRCAEGYRGRFALLETLPVDDNIRKMIINGSNQIEIKEYAVSRGMITLRRAGLLNAMRGNTSLEEVLRVTVSD